MILNTDLLKITGDQTSLKYFLARSYVCTLSQFPPKFWSLGLQVLEFRFLLVESFSFLKCARKKMVILRGPGRAQSVKCLSVSAQVLISGVGDPTPEVCVWLDLIAVCLRLSLPVPLPLLPFSLFLKLIHLKKKMVILVLFHFFLFLKIQFSS